MNKTHERGFTLMELLIVLTIIATLTGVMVGGRKSGVQKEYRRFFRRFSVMTKEMRNRSQLRGTTLRFIFKLEDEKPMVFWAEEAKGKVLLSDSKKTEELFEDLYDNLGKDEVKKKEIRDRKKEKNNFKKLKKFSSKRLSTPSSLTIKQIEISGLDKPINSEIAFFHFFPEGFVEEVAIQVQTLDESLKWTLVTEPLTGEFITLKGHTDLKELQDRD